MNLPVNKIDSVIRCGRCKTPCKVDKLRNPKAKMLRRSKEPKGLCINCAVHDWLRNTYPPNILLAQSGPKMLLFPHIQQQFAGIMRIAFADAKPDEIDWQRIVDNWDLPFPHKIKPTATNSCSQLELDEIATGNRPGIGSSGRPTLREIADKGPITSFEQLNELKPGLGDQFKKCLRDKPENKEPTLFD